jgi:RNA polymerase sigma-70 factor (ECF subfamily)
MRDRLEKVFIDEISRNQGIIKRLVNLYSDNEEEKKDLYQEIVLQAWKAYPRFRGDSQFSTWLYKVTLNTILTARRKPDRTVYPEEMPDSLMASSPPGIEAERSRALRQAIRTLPEIDRAIISLHLDGYGNAEISAIMGISPNHVGVKLHRIKQQLTNLFQPR